MIEKLVFNARTHAYWVDGQRWSGASSWGKLIEDRTRLESWALRMCLLGAAMEPQLLDEAVAVQDDRRALDDLTWRARQRAGADSAARKGSAHHRLTELADLDRLTVISDSARIVVDRWRAALAAAGIEILPQYVERVSLNPVLQCCGTFDRIVRYDGRLVVADLKTGSRGVDYPHGMAVQLAVIANAELLACNGMTRGDQTTYSEFVPMPEVDRQTGIIIAMPSDGSHAEVYEIDLVAGWDAAQIAHQAKQWGARKNLTRLVATTAPLPDPIIPERVVPIPADPFDGLNGEAMIEASLPAPKPVVAVAPTDEGDLVDETAIEAIRRALERASEHPAIKRWYSEAHTAGWSIAIRDRQWQTVRRFEIARAAIALVALGDSEIDDVARTIIGLVTGDEIQPTVTVGQALGALTTTDAQKVAALAHAVNAGETVSLHARLDGTWGVIGDITAATAV